MTLAEAAPRCGAGVTRSDDDAAKASKRIPSVARANRIMRLGKPMPSSVSWSERFGLSGIALVHVFRGRPIRQDPPRADATMPRPSPRKGELAHRPAHVSMRTLSIVAVLAGAAVVAGATPSMAAPPAVARTASPLDAVRNWGYWLSSLEIARAAAAPHDLLVIDSEVSANR